MKGRNQFTRLFLIVAVVELAASVLYFCREKIPLGLLYLSCACAFYVLGMRREDEEEQDGEAEQMEDGREKEEASNE